MEHHAGKAVRVSGEVNRVSLGSLPTRIPSVTLKSTPALLLFFDVRDDDYDPASMVLALNESDHIVVSGQIHQVDPQVVSLHHCRLVEARRRTA